MLVLATNKLGLALGRSFGPYSTDDWTSQKELVKLVRLLRTIIARLRSASARDVIIYVCLCPMVVATILYGLSYAARDIELFAGLAQQARDDYAKMHVNGVAPNAGAVPIVLLDYDDETMRRLEDPAVVPPQSLALVLQRVAALSPWAVLVDLDLTHVDDPRAVAALEAALSTLGSRETAVLLARPVLQGASQTHPSRIRPTPLDDFVRKSPNIFWVSVEFRETKDGLVRRLPTIMPVAFEGRCTMLPSAPLALKLLQKTASASQTKVALAAAASKVSCDPRAKPSPLIIEYLPGLSLKTTPDDGAINYTLGWRPDGAPPRFGVGMLSRPQIIAAPVFPLLDSSGAFDEEAFRAALVVIGRSANRYDFHHTPVDSMPGTLVLANGARTILEDQQDKPRFLPGLLQLISTTFLISIATIPIHHFAGRWRWLVKLTLPAVLTTTIWLAFYLSGHPGVSASLIVSAAVILTTVELGHERAEHLRKARKGAS